MYVIFATLGVRLCDVGGHIRTSWCQLMFVFCECVAATNVGICCVCIIHMCLCALTRVHSICCMYGISRSRRFDAMEDIYIIHQTIAYIYGLQNGVSVCLCAGMRSWC